MKIFIFLYIKSEYFIKKYLISLWIPVNSSTNLGIVQCGGTDLNLNSIELFSSWANLLRKNGKCLLAKGGCYEL